MSKAKFFALALFLIAAPAAAQINNPGVTQSGNVVNGNCAKWGPSTGQISDAGTACGGGGGTPGGTAGQVQYNNAGAFGGFTVSGDGTLNTSTGGLIVTKTNGVSFAASATTDTTNAANISAGILNAARIPSTFVQQSGAATLNNCVKWAGTSLISDSGGPCGGAPGGTSGQVQFNNAGAFGGFTVGGDGTLNTGTGSLIVTKTNGVAFAASATTDTTNAANIASGTLNAARLPTTITAPTAFQGGLSVGSGVAVPATADYYNTQTARAGAWISTRSQVLGSGSSVADLTFLGLNASSTAKTWADVWAGVPYCRGRPSVAGFSCAPNTTTAGSEEGAFYVTTLATGNTISLATTATAGAGTAVLTFASSVQDSGNLVGKTVADTTTPAAIPAGTFVRQQTATTITLSQNISAPGVGSGDTITFSGNDMVWFDSAGLTVGGQRNVYIPAGQGIVSFDSTGTAEYILSYNSHANNSVDLQSWNTVGGAKPSSGPAFRFYTSASGAGQPAMQIAYDDTITINALSGSASGTKPLCLDASNRLVKASGASCP